MPIQDLLVGATMMGYGVVSLFFLRFWTRTRDRLFACFSVAFAMMAVERFFSTSLSPEEEPHSFIFVLRLLAFLLIIWGIVDKNRR